MKTVSKHIFFCEIFWIVFSQFCHRHSTLVRNQTMRLVPCQTATVAGNFRKNHNEPSNVQVPESPCFGMLVAAGLAIPLYTEIQGCLCQLCWLVGQTRKGHRGLWQGLQQKAGPKTSLSTGLHLRFCCLDVDYLGSWHGPQLGRRYTTWATGVRPSGTSIRSYIVFPLTPTPCMVGQNLLICFVTRYLWNHLLFLPNFQQLTGELGCDVQRFVSFSSWP